MEEKSVSLDFRIRHPFCKSKNEEDLVLLSTLVLGLSLGLGLALGRLSGLQLLISLGLLILLGLRVLVLGLVGHL